MRIQKFIHTRRHICKILFITKYIKNTEKNVCSTQPPVIYFLFYFIIYFTLDYHSTQKTPLLQFVEYFA